MRTSSVSFFKGLLISNFLLVLLLIIYSYSQVDLNLTLSSAPLYLFFQQQLTALGYFNRGLSVLIYTVIVIWLFVQYGVTVLLAARGKINHQQAWILVGINTLLICAYPAFSYDIFNYLFDGRIVVKYGLDPRFFKALDFPLDPWVRFMHWTHRYYPYGPGWLLISLPPVILGMGKFVLSLFLFKLMLGGFYLLSCWSIARLSKSLNEKKSVGALIFFALNPLILVEGLIAGHNELVMLALSLLSFYYFSQKRSIKSGVSLLASASIKYVSAPLFLILLFWKGKISSRVYEIAWGISLCVALLLSTQRELYGWYFLPALSFAALVSNRFIRIVSLSMSAVFLVLYGVFFYIGEYSNAYWDLFKLTGIISIIVSLSLSILFTQLLRTKKAS